MTAPLDTRVVPDDVLAAAARALIPPAFTQALEDTWRAAKIVTQALEDTRRTARIVSEAFSAFQETARRSQEASKIVTAAATTGPGLTELLLEARAHRATFLHRAPQSRCRQARLLIREVELEPTARDACRLFEVIASYNSAAIRRTRDAAPPGSWEAAFLEFVLALLVGRNDTEELAFRARLLLRLHVRASSETTSRPPSYEQTTGPPPERLDVLASEDLALAPPRYRGRPCSRVLEVTA